MKKWIKKIGQNKFQFFFFVGLVCLLVLSIVIANASTNRHEDLPKPSDEINDKTPGNSDTEDPVGTVAPEFVTLPLDPTKDYKIVRKFYEKDGSKEDQAESLIKYDNTFRTSLGTSYALKDGGYFDVTASITGTVSEVSSSPLFGNYVVITSDNDLKTYYYGLSEVCISKGSEVKQGEKLGIAGTTSVDQETGVHVYFQIQKAGKFLNPEKIIGSKVTEI